MDTSSSSDLDRILHSLEKLRKGDSNASYFLRTHPHPLLTELLLPLLDDPIAAVRLGAIQALGFKGNAQAVDRLIAKLAINSEGNDAALALGRIGDLRAIDALIHQLDQPSFHYTNIVKALGLLGDRRAVAPILARESESVLSDAALEAFSLIPAGEAISRLCTTLEWLFKPEQRSKLFLQPHRHAVLALKLAGWQPDQSLATFLFYLHENSPSILHCGALAITWLVEILPIVPEHKLAELFAVIKAIYEAANTPPEIRQRIEALQDQKVYRQRCVGKIIDVALSYFLMDAEQRPNLCGNAPDYFGEGNAPGIAPHASCIIRTTEIGKQETLTPTQSTTQVGRFVKQAIDRFAHLVLRVEPWHEEPTIRFTNHVETFTLHPEYTSAIVAAIYREAIERGVNNKSVVGMQITLLDAIEHPIDSRADAFRAATTLALRAAFAEIVLPQ